ncbi:uncharacterized protein EI90DRAFT_3138967 [Cantharellus anzutake]|uniref:uncharacterized protein n=1 Tax=Cantharellus anzutake TaxID=1750568 RepID=UPI0019056A2E|nr:uncharacterized protein EI90DRAFT_3138967 [Cantharellus anzutake]KAF8310922.1 hypothetical protein EI90DRAFT_3138967 [Cantharellus anzutake]
MQIRQIGQKEEFLDHAAKSSFESRKKAADDYNWRHAHCMKLDNYKPGEFVLVSNEHIKLQHDMKGQPRWFGPYIIVKRLQSGTFVLQELDGAVFKRPVAGKRIKSYHYCKSKEPVIRKPVELQDDKILEESKANNLSLSVNLKQPGLPKPWELRGKALDKYWQEKYKHMLQRATDPEVKFPPSTYKEDLERKGNSSASKVYPTESQPYSSGYLGGEGEYIPQESYPITAETTNSTRADAKGEFGNATVEVIPPAETKQTDKPAEGERACITIEAALEPNPTREGIDVDTNFVLDCAMAHYVSGSPYPCHERLWETSPQSYHDDKYEVHEGEVAGILPPEEAKVQPEEALINLSLHLVQGASKCRRSHSPSPKCSRIEDDTVRALQDKVKQLESVVHAQTKSQEAESSSKQHHTGFREEAPLQKPTVTKKPFIEGSQPSHRHNSRVPPKPSTYMGNIGNLP